MEMEYRQEVRRREAVWELSDCTAKSFRGANRHVCSSLSMWEAQLCVCVGACVCTVCEWVDTVCAIRFVVHRSLEKSSRNTKVEKIILEHLKQNCVCLCVCVFFKYNHTYFDFRLVSA